MWSCINIILQGRNETSSGGERVSGFLQSVQLNLPALWRYTALITIPPCFPTNRKFTFKLRSMRCYLNTTTWYHFFRLLSGPSLHNLGPHLSNVRTEHPNILDSFVLYVRTFKIINVHECAIKDKPLAKLRRFLCVNWNANFNWIQSFLCLWAVLTHRLGASFTHILVNEAPGVFTQTSLSDVSGEGEGTAFHIIDVNYVKNYTSVLYYQKLNHRNLFLLDL